ncbi:trimeric intracellular cation channel family protein [Croceibacter atlanticus]|jgi:uncharacterized membrane protein YeiH|uniref:Membrane protein n=1 Tax=Croceibacter atlanticus (strain ATCC BAA-628 / JCM 21780 / CIP 108009 / IAM 15332 / KCTC 12090 / HTCC2559) TaxID=216432 RepID=A3U8T1_CROAH|nr:trimeric intracellular cation channel family protein [Croceibacter atlanticus]EAP86217.1 membrane protein [Croceibacter atlanticus HTCC2559]MBW4968922.1 trimeric intracellular cation channel family protein [Croceibacter atlanticus]
MDFFVFVDLIGTIAFAISGVLTATKKRMDVFGIIIIAFVTSIGGGTLRDLLVGFPVAWIRNTYYVYFIIGCTILAILFRRKLRHVRTSLFLFDTIGIGLYTVVGIEKGLSADLSPVICVALGTVTATFGGVIRDILCNEIPVVFRKEIYATACILGGVSYFVLLFLTPIPEGIIFVIAGSIVITFRLLAVHYKWILPTIYSKEELENLN